MAGGCQVPIHEPARDLHSFLLDVHLRPKGIEWTNSVLFLPSHHEPSNVKILDRTGIL